LDKTSIDLIDISGGTYFPGAKSASDSFGSGPYFTDVSLRSRARTAKPLMLTGGFKIRDQSVDALNSNSADLIGLAGSCSTLHCLTIGKKITIQTRYFPNFSCHQTVG
jgi:2,4-dienoyl-CoA reductase-like NADH-dependent reductase (Old Yellow Enzyme family)